MNYDELRELLFDASYCVIDFLPRQVPAGSGGKYFAVEKYFSEHPRIDALYQSFAGIALKLGCYYGLALYDPAGDAWIDNPQPELLARRIEECAFPGKERYVQLLFPGEGAMLELNGGDLYMTLYAPSDELRETAEKLAGAEGLFLREPGDCI